jgi:alpha/beta superfamily hydrolase
MPEIQSNSVLPAHRRPITLHTADGVDLVGELALPAGRPPIGTLICLHPLPTHGGMMDSHLFRKAAWRLPAQAGVAVLRFNTRGTSSVQGTSGGEFGGGETERLDVAAAIEYAEFHDLPVPWLAGWSFGAELALKYGCDPTVVGAILFSPPMKLVSDADLVPWAKTGKPVIALVPEFDDYLRPDEARERFRPVPHAKVIAVDGARHLWVGYADRALDYLVRRVAPKSYPLPAEWDGEMAPGDVSAYADRTLSSAEVPGVYRLDHSLPDHGLALAEDES